MSTRGVARIAALAAGAVLLACTAALAQAPAQESGAVPAGNAERGKELFNKVGCYQCHGYVAQGGAGPRLAPNPMPFLRFTRYLRAPTRSMPAYSTMVVSAQDVADLYAFLRAVPPALDLDSIPLLAPSQFLAVAPKP